MFEKGDRVIYIKKEYDFLYGKIGTVAYVDNRCDEVYIVFDEPFEYGHSLYGSCENGHGWIAKQESIRLVYDQDDQQLFEFSERDLLSMLKG